MFFGGGGVRANARRPYGPGIDTNEVGILKIKTPFRAPSLALELFRAHRQVPSTLFRP